MTDLYTIPDITLYVELGRAGGLGGLGRVELSCVGKELGCGLAALAAVGLG